MALAVKVTDFIVVGRKSIEERGAFSTKLVARLLARLVKTDSCVQNFFRGKECARRVPSKILHNSRPLNVCYKRMSHHATVTAIMALRQKQKGAQQDCDPSGEAQRRHLTAPRILFTLLVILYCAILRWSRKQEAGKHQTTCWWYAMVCLACQTKISDMFSGHLIHIPRCKELAASVSYLGHDMVLPSSSAMYNASTNNDHPKLQT